MWRLNLGLAVINTGLAFFNADHPFGLLCAGCAGMCFMAAIEKDARETEQNTQRPKIEKDAREAERWITKSAEQLECARCSHQLEYDTDVGLYCPNCRGITK